MKVKFVKTQKQYLDQLPIVDGQIIAITDEDGIYYDMNGTRYNPADAVFWEDITEEE